MRVPTKTASQWQENVNAYFKARSSYWKDIYAGGGVQAEIYRTRQNTALAWIDELALTPDARILEIGCGAGFMSIELARKGFHVQATDSNEAMVNLARENVAKAGISELISLEACDVCGMVFQDNFFDLVIAIGVIPWLAQPELALQEMARVTKPEGSVLLTADNEWRLINLMDPLTNPTLTPLRKGIKNILERKGFYHEPPGRVMETFHKCGSIDETLMDVGLMKTKGTTLGFGPFTFLSHKILPTILDIELHRKLQRFADRNMPGFRSSGAHYLVLARKQSS